MKLRRAVRSAGALAFILASAGVWAHPGHGEIYVWHTHGAELPTANAILVLGISLALGIAAFRAYRHKRALDLKRNKPRR